MEHSKIEISAGNLKFSGEGEQKWLSEQLDKILEKSEKLAKFNATVAAATAPAVAGTNAASTKTTSSISETSLAKFLKDSSATDNQMKKFLGAAVWLSETKNKNSLKTSDITVALKDAGQTRLGNPSDCLAKIIKKGHLEKTNGSEFMVTVHGKEEFGING